MANYLFEVSWEVCHFVGGIHTVISSKAARAVEYRGDEYFMLGPMLEENPGFQETDEPEWETIRAALDARGLSCRLGRWQIPGRPKVMLVDFRQAVDIEKILYEYWQHFGVDSMSGDWDYMEPVLFSTVCGMAIEAAFKNLARKGDQAQAHFHEWMCGGGLLYLRKNTPEIGTVFTTHATVLGRSLAGAGVDVYGDRHAEPNLEAKSQGVLAKHSLETACAREADVFSTVSRVTADEAGAVLRERPDTVVFNGIDLTNMPRGAVIREMAKTSRQKLLQKFGAFLGRDLPPDTRLWLTSGRYEFHNKGYDIILESLARLNEQLAGDLSLPPVVCCFAITADNQGLIRREGTNGNAASPVMTHSLEDTGHPDPITSSCRHLNLRNSPEQKISVVFAPACLDGNDGFFDMTYDEVLRGFDLGVFPSWYEPWGYTPLEALASGVPTVTSNLAGFGRWVQEFSRDHQREVAILARAGRSTEEVVSELTGMLRDFARMDPREMSGLRQRARALAGQADWKTFFRGYEQAYEQAAEMTARRLDTLDSSAYSGHLFSRTESRDSRVPRYRTFTVAPVLPEDLVDLRNLARNLWWSWHPGAVRMFRMLDEDRWRRSGHNPVRLLSSLTINQLEEKSRDAGFMQCYRRVLAEFHTYMEGAGSGRNLTPHLDRRHPVVYFSMEYGLHESLPIYSGGLGILSGDHLKAASDLDIPLVSVGLFYRQGYFRQSIDRSGHQVEDYPQMDPSRSPVRVLREAESRREVRLRVHLDGRDVNLRVWYVDVGRVTLYLLDTDLEENSAMDRRISARLYGGDKKYRMEQEIILGVGGVKLVEDVLLLKPRLYHLNEGHCSFMLFERIARFMDRGLDFLEAREAVRATTVFTTHTPVPAGNETFDRGLIRDHFHSYMETFSIDFNRFMEMGLSHPGESGENFSMTVLALKLSSRANGVSRLHARVCKEMWQDVWKGLAEEEVPISAITNGVHMASWTGEAFRDLYDETLGLDWDTHGRDPDIWKGISAIPDERLWQAHGQQKQILLDAIRELVRESYSRRGESSKVIQDVLARINPEALTVGFARRFATYKRATLLFRNQKHLKRLLTDENRPVLFLFAGKAHPADQSGKELIAQIIALSRQKEFRGHIIYLEDYDIRLGRLLVQGVDLWLNTPVQPHEASGTSGMKAVPNGVLNFSILDGWWSEAFDPACGFAIDSGVRGYDREHQDEVDNAAMISRFQEKIVPLYFNRDDQGVPVGWVTMMKNSISRYTPEFSTMRMVRQYVDEMYEPTAARGQELLNEDHQGIRDLTEWKRKIGARFSTAHIEDVVVRGIEGDFLHPRASLEVEMVVHAGQMNAYELQAELVLGEIHDEPGAVSPQVVPFGKGEPLHQSNRIRFRLSHKVTESGLYRYAMRLVPVHPLLLGTDETGLVCWG